jgi:hypothetical protein
VQPGARQLRVWSLLEATYEQADWAALPPEGVPGLQRQRPLDRNDLGRAASATLDTR